MQDRLIKARAVKGRVDVPPSKSMTIRALTAALLACGESVIRNPSYSDDALACLSILETLGADSKPAEGEVRVVGTSGLKRQIRGTTINAGESGLCARMFVPVVAVREEEFWVTGSGSLLKRPFAMVEELRKFGAKSSTPSGLLPVRVKGPLLGGKGSIRGEITSQFLTGLLFSLPLAPSDSSISVTDLKSRPYVRMTLETLRMSGVEVTCDESLSQFEIKGEQRFKPISYTCEGDWSSASFFLVAAAISGSLELKGLSLDSRQADKVILEVLRAHGTNVATGDGSILVEQGEARGFDFDAQEAPDLVPPLFVLAAFSKGRSRIFGIERLKYKESSRVDLLAKIFSKLGVRVEVLPGMAIIEGGSIGGGIVDPEGDHRIAMALAIAALRSKEGIRILNAQCVRKSYPSFFQDLERICGE
jgi:3-phosphoshikimate 1-carboxyvinyltransferase